MKVILLQNIETLGNEGDTIKVKDGYARNYLIPRKLAVSYTPLAIKILEAKKRRNEQEREKEKKRLQELAKKISQVSLTIQMESGVSDTLFGSVTPDMIFHELLQHEGIEVDKKSIVIEEPIRKLGVYTVEIKLHPEVKENLRVWVVKK